MKKTKGSVTVFALIVLGLTIGMYLFGYTSILIDHFMTEEEYYNNTDAGGFINKIFNTIIEGLTSKIGLSTLALIVGFGFLSGIAGSGYVSGSILAFLIPCIILFGVANVFFFPVLSHIEGHMVYQPVNILLQVVLNVFLMLTVIEFVSGRD